MRIRLADVAAGLAPVDVCIVGAGAAGLSLAARLVEAGARVLLCEGGGAEYSARSQALYRGETVGDPCIPMEFSRLRYFGGTTNHWGGWCRPLERYDFAAKLAAPITAWPIDRADLKPFAAAAAGILDVRPLRADEPIPGSGLQRIDFSITPPARLRLKYAELVTASPNLLYCAEANLFRLHATGDRIDAAVFRGYGGEQATAHARYLVLATGGIENSRLLLWCNRIADGRIVKDPTTLGRYWMEHPHFTVAQAVMTDGSCFGLNESELVFLAPTAATLSRCRILNCSLRLHRVGVPDTQRLIAELSAAAPRFGRRLAALAGTGTGMVCAAHIRAAWEQEPRADNRIELDVERDQLDMPRARLHWHKSELDVHTVRETALTVGRYLLDHDIGRLRIEPWLLQEPAVFPEVGELVGRHHMGGTRMSDSPATGIVDRDCRVFGQDNLYVAGSSVFPSSGHANPTLTIVQLALRLGDHLLSRLRQPV